MLAVVLLGPGPAALLGVATMTLLVGPARVRHGTTCCNNVVDVRVVPADRGSVLPRDASTCTRLGPRCAGLLPSRLRDVRRGPGGELHRRRSATTCYLDGASLAQKTRTLLIPSCSAELFSALLTMAVVYVAVEAGTVGIVLVLHSSAHLPVSHRRAAEVQASRRATSSDRHDRRADRARQPRAVPRSARRADRGRAGQRGDVRRDAARPRPLQGDQRHARPSLRR